MSAPSNYLTAGEFPTKDHAVYAAIEHAQSMHQWMIDNGADQEATDNSLRIVEYVLRRAYEQ